jgi:hypothetical protein
MEMTKKIIERAVEEARKFGDSYLGEVCFDPIKDCKKVNNYLRKNNINDCYLIHVSDTDHDNGWFIICK